MITFDDGVKHEPQKVVRETNEVAYFIDYDPVNFPDGGSDGFMKIDPNAAEELPFV